MKKFTLSHEINCSAEDFWKVFFDRDFNNTLFREVLGFPEFDIVEQTETDEALIRIIRGRPKMDMPKPVMKLLGDSFAYEEEGRFDLKSKTWSWKMKPNTMADKLRNEGKLRVEAIGDNKCRRITEMLSEAKVFGVGGLLESATEKEMRKGWDRSAVFMNDWLVKHPPG